MDRNHARGRREPSPPLPNAKNQATQLVRSATIANRFRSCDLQVAYEPGAVPLGHSDLGEGGCSSGLSVIFRVVEEPRRDGNGADEERAEGGMEGGSEPQAIRKHWQHGARLAETHRLTGVARSTRVGKQGSDIVSRHVHPSPSPRGEVRCGDQMVPPYMVRAFRTLCKRKPRHWCHFATRAAIRAVKRR